MANRAGLRKVVKTVRGKKGSVRRSYWVRAGDAVKSGAKAAGGFVGRHKGAIAGAVALAAMAGIAHHGNSQYKKQFGTGIYSAFRGAGTGRVRSAANAAGYGTVIGALHIGGAVHSTATEARATVGQLGGVRNTAKLVGMNAVQNARGAASRGAKAARRGFWGALGAVRGHNRPAFESGRRADFGGFGNMPGAGRG